LKLLNQEIVGPNRTVNDFEAFFFFEMHERAEILPHLMFLWREQVSVSIDKTQLREFHHRLLHHYQL
jgi:hypothetical protein